MKHKMNIDDKISFVSGGTFTTLMTLPLYELWLALLLGLVGGVGGMMGKFLWAKFMKFVNKKK